MIAFDLRCVEHHIFEAWFKDREAYEDQREKGLISCPVCGSTEVEKILSPVAIKKSSPASASSAKPAAGAGDGAEVQEGFLKAMEKIYKTVLENSEDVGTRFASEALKIHYGAAEARSIRGVTTDEEEKMLQEEGVQFTKIPVPAKMVKKEEIN